MTRNEFVSKWEAGDLSFYEAVEIMGDYDYTEYFSYIDSDSYDEAVEDDIRDFLQNNWWYDMDLGTLPTHYDWYRREGCLDYYGIDDTDDEIESFVQWMDNNRAWEDEDEEDEWEDVPEEEPAQEAEFSEEDVIGLLTVCQSDLQAIYEDEENKKKNCWEMNAPEQNIMEFASVSVAEAELLPF